MKAALYKMHCLTNQHVGSGDAGYSVIGNEVEKDIVLGTPTIHASGVRGSYRAYFKHKGVKEETILEWFGSDIKDSQKDQRGSQPGRLRFLAANLLARPVRVSKGNVAYVLATTRSLLKTYAQLCRQFGFSAPQFLAELAALSMEKNYFFSKDAAKVEKVEECVVQPVTTGCAALQRFFAKLFPQESVVVLKEEEFQAIELPVVARNQLDDGTSVNLWYEEVVPHESVFYNIVLAHTGDLNTFDQEIHSKVIQFGGNASVGCGYTLVTRLQPEDDKK